MAHIKVVDRWEDGKPTPIPPDAKVRAHAGGEIDDPFFATVYIDDYLLIKVQHSDDDMTALTASASLTSDHVRLFGQGEEGVTPILAPEKSTDWDTAVDAFGFAIYSHTIRIPFPHDKVDMIKRLHQWPMDRRQANLKGILSMTGKLWNLTYVVRVGGCFVWRPMRLTGLLDAPGSKNHNRTVEFGKDVHADLLVWKG